MEPRDEHALGPLAQTAGLWVARPDGSLIYASEDVARRLGLSPSEVEGDGWLHRFGALGDDPALPERWLRWMSERGVFKDIVELRSESPGGVRTVLRIEGHTLDDPATASRLCVALVSQHFVDPSPHSESSLAMAREDARLAERRHIARELHANLQQLLYATKIHLSKLLRSQSLTQAQDAGESIQRIIEETIRVSRDLTRGLIPLTATGLGAALESLAAWMRDHHALDVEIEIEGDIESSSLALRQIAFECVRELLFNCVKHADVESATLRVDGRGEALEFSVVDSGEGFEATPESFREPRDDRAGGFGLPDMQARVERIGGKLEMKSRPGVGTRAVLKLPRSGPS